MFQFPIGIFNHVESASGAVDFTFTVDTTKAGSASNTMVLPWSNSTQTVHWGDASTSTTNTHIYDTGGEYEIWIEDTVTGWDFNGGGDCAKILDIKSWDSVIFTGSVGGAFKECTSLTISATNYPDTSGCTNFGSFFDGCIALDAIDLSDWDTTAATSALNMFNDCESLETIDMSNFIDSDFERCDGMFRDCAVLTSIDITGWDTSGVTNFGTMLYHCDSLTSFDLASLDLSSATTMTNMCTYATLDESSINAGYIAWDTVPYTGLVFHEGYATATGTGLTARTSLVNDHSWTISTQ